MISKISDFLKSITPKSRKNLISVFGVLSNKFAQVLLQLTLVRILIPADYSNFYFFYASVTGLSVFIGEGMGQTISRYLSSHAAGKDNALLNSLTVGFCVSIFASILILSHMFFIKHTDFNSSSVLVVTLLALMYSFASILQYVSATLNLNKFLASLQFTIAVTTLFSTSYLSYKFGWLVGIQSLLATMFAFNTLLLFKIISATSLKFQRFEANIWNELLTKAIPIIGSMALGAPVHVFCLSILNSSTARTAPEQVGIFGASFVAYTLVSFLPGSLGQFLVPWLLKHNKENTIELALDSVKILYLKIALVFLTFISILLLFGIGNLIPTLKTANTTIVILSLTGVFAGLIALKSFYLNSIYRSKLVFFSSIYHSISYISLSFLFVKVFNLQASGLASAIMLSSLGQLIILKYKTDIIKKNKLRNSNQDTKMNSFLLNQIRKYVKWHLGLFFKVYRHLMGKTSGNLFSFLFNIAAIIRNNKTRVTYLNSNDGYQAAHGDFKVNFYHTKQASMAYCDGIYERAMQIGRAYFLDRIDFKDNDVVLDCGANVGDLLLYFKLKKLNIKYVGFEPSPLEYKSLAKNVNPYVSHNLGLWKEDGMLTFYVSSQGADSSLIEPIKYDAKIEVKTVRLDSIINGPIKLLKLEAEGAEPEVLLGASGLLNSIEYISADLGFERGKTQESTLAPVVNYLCTNGFDLLDVSHERVIALFRNKNFRS